MNFYTLRNNHTEALMLHNGLCTFIIENIFMYLPTSKNEKSLTALELENNKCFFVDFTLKCYVLIDVLELDNVIKVSTNDVSDVAFLFSTELLTLFISCVARIGGSPSTSAELALRQATRMYKDGEKQVSGAHHELFIKVYDTGQDCF